MRMTKTMENHGQCRMADNGRMTNTGKGHTMRNDRQWEMTDNSE